MIFKSIVFIRSHQRRLSDDFIRRPCLLAGIWTIGKPGQSGKSRSSNNQPPEAHNYFSSCYRTWWIQTQDSWSFANDRSDDYSRCNGCTETTGKIVHVQVPFAVVSCCAHTKRVHPGMCMCSAAGIIVNKTARYVNRAWFDRDAYKRGRFTYAESLRGKKW